MRMAAQRIGAQGDEIVVPLLDLGGGDRASEDAYDEGGIGLAIQW